MFSFICEQKLRKLYRKKIKYYEFMMSVHHSAVAKQSKAKYHVYNVHIYDQNPNFD